MFDDLEAFDDELSRILAYAAELDRDEVAEILEREARKLRNPDVLEGDILEPEE